MVLNAASGSAPRPAESARERDAAAARDGRRVPGWLTSGASAGDLWWRPDRDVAVEARPGECPDQVLRRGRNRWRLFASIFTIYLVYPLAALHERQHGVAVAAGVLLLLGFLVLYLGALPVAAWGGPPLARRGTVPAMLVTMAVLLPIGGPEQLALSVYIVVAAVMLLPLALAGTLVVLLVVASTAGPRLVPAWHTPTLQWSAGFAVLISALIMVGVIRLVRSNAYLRLAREEVARLAAEQERLRIARDLHDLIGHSLTTVTVKAALARRLVARDPGRAQDEIAEVEALARQSLADVRAALAGYREVTLAVELAAAREVLAAADIAVELPGAIDDVPAELRELFGWAVREGVTNVVRHSGARHCRITVSPTCLEVRDDGGGARAGSAGPGSGLAGLAARAAAAGATVSAGAMAGGGWRVRVEVAR